MSVKSLGLDPNGFSECFKGNFIYLFVFGCAGSLLLCRQLSAAHHQCSGFSCGVFSCGAWAVELAGLGRCDVWAQLRLPGCGADSVAVGQGFVACGIFPDQGSISYIDMWILYHWTTRKVKVAQTCLTLCNSMDRTVLGILQARILEWVSLFLLQGIFPTQGLNPGLLPCRWILYQLPEKPLKYKKIY